MLIVTGLIFPYTNDFFVLNTNCINLDIVFLADVFLYSIDDMELAMHVKMVYNVYIQRPALGVL